MIGVVCAAGLFLFSASNTTASREEWVYAEPPLPIDTIRGEVKAVSGGILYPLSIMVSEDRLVVCQPDMEQMFSVYRLPDIDYLYSFGRKGQGPDEFATIYFKRIVPTDEGFKLCCNDRRIYRVSLDDGSILNKEKIVSDYDLFNGFAVINDSLCCFTDMRGKDTPFLMYNSGYVVAKDDGSVWAFFYGYFDCFEIYGNDGVLQKTICTGRSPYEKSGKRRVCYPYVPQTVGEYIYCIRSRENLSAADQLQVWRWDGTPVVSYWLDRRISSFALSERTGKIYAVSTDEGAADQIFVYDLPYY